MIARRAVTVVRVLYDRARLFALVRAATAWPHARPPQRRSRLAIRGAPTVVLVADARAHRQVRAPLRRRVGVDLGAVRHRVQ